MKFLSAALAALAAAAVATPSTAADRSRRGGPRDDDGPPVTKSTPASADDYFLCDGLLDPSYFAPDADRKYRKCEYRKSRNSVCRTDGGGGGSIGSDYKVYDYARYGWERNDCKTYCNFYHECTGFGFGANKDCTIWWYDSTDFNTRKDQTTKKSWCYWKKKRAPADKLIMSE
eukprot:CAMPEP_0194314814 /NCGR_PEP_ID=MMETSP0171-20130528/11628_1 /TAXON_ID=218684 /ORGANISM="Corethron pennatum, Strain L29A3" /LENGTH=172 /DNA_ID=CAMNT_0039070373 /DNA_START=121 /DNA_END=639 /DNA_ORIENTATION=-